MLQKQHVSVAPEGELVIIGIAGFPFALEFDAALDLSAAVRLNARMGKLGAGNRERGVYAVGVLSDADPRTRRRVRFASKLPDRLKRHDIQVGLRGQIVTITIKGTTIEMPYDSARAFAQWLRVRGKEAKVAAGEAAHWSTFVNHRSALP